MSVKIIKKKEGSQDEYLCEENGREIIITAGTLKMLYGIEVEDGKH